MFSEGKNSAPLNRKGLLGNSEHTKTHLFDENGFLVFSQGISLSDEELEKGSCWGISRLFFDSQEQEQEAEGADEQEDIVSQILAIDETILRSGEEIVKFMASYKRVEEEYEVRREKFIRFYNSFFQDRGDDLRLPFPESGIPIVKDMLRSLSKDHMILTAILLNDKEYEAEELNAVHTLKTTYYSLMIGLELKLPAHKITEIGIASIFHEVGMRKIPVEFYTKEKNLNDKEFDIIKKHPELGFADMRNNNFKTSIAAAVLEHHERNDGSGYPYGLHSEEISDYGKIIGLSCCFEANTSKRAHRSAETGYYSLVKLAKEFASVYDADCLKSLMAKISLIPAGSYVKLKGGYLGVVIESNPRSPRILGVHLLSDKRGVPLKQQVAITTQEEGDFSVAKILQRS